MLNTTLTKILLIVTSATLLIPWFAGNAGAIDTPSGSSSDRQTHVVYILNTGSPNSSYVVPTLQKAQACLSVHPGLGGLLCNSALAHGAITQATDYPGAPHQLLSTPAGITRRAMTRDAGQDAPGNIGDLFRYTNWMYHNSLGQGSPLIRSFKIANADPNLGQFGCDAFCQKFALSGFAETYDQALAAIVYAETGNELQRNLLQAWAHNILAYFARSGAVPYESNSESVVRTGDVVWLGMAAAQYAQRYGGDQTTDQIFSIVDNYLKTVQQPSGGILGGPRCHLDINGAQ